MIGAKCCSCPKSSATCRMGNLPASYSDRMKRKAPRRRIGFLLFDGVVALDVVGPLEAFAVANSDRGAYELLTVSMRHSTVTSESGIVFKPDVTLPDCPHLDTLVVPGGATLREPGPGAAILAWIAHRAPTTRRIASVCTGIFGIAPTGLLDGRAVTTHWRFADELARRFPALQVDADALFIKDGSFYTSAGITAGIDLSLALIEEDLGRTTALRVARELVVYMKRAGGQNQYSEPLRGQVAAIGRIREVAAFIDAHLAGDLSAARLAEFAHLSVRQFDRRFRESFDASPAAYVKAARMHRARELLCSSDCNVVQVATAVGFASDDVFRRAFEHRFGVSPLHFRQRFGQTGS